ncbi:NACHT domain-containing protein [Streptomyces sp. NPDC051211]|uniref:NACHT domain-containing protein n=1 Tax=Streptomyces sp. NPDC051211 TaxID=3154643 RepID=UPI00344E0BBC
MDASVAGVKLASSVVAPLIRRLFWPETPGAGLVPRQVRIAALVSFREKRRLTDKELRKLADRLVTEALAAPGERPLPEGEEDGVAAALAVTLGALGAIEMHDVQAVRLGHRAFARELRAAAPRPVLSRDAQYFYEQLLEATCLHILHFFTTRSTFGPATLLQQSRDLQELIDKMDVLLDRAHRPDGRDTAFERDYLASVARRYSTLTIFGLDLPPSSTTWPMDVAYLDLGVTSPAPFEATDTPPVGAPAPSAAPALADQVLTRHTRALLRGEAGSGKTTLIQWLAVSAARRERGTADPVPFVLPLRTLTRHGARLPQPKDFLAAVGASIASEQPDGWAVRVLRGRRALVLVDGLDEIPESERPVAREWLADLIATYPDNRWLVTTRPSAVRQDWLIDEAFTELTLSPMNRPEVAGFIDRWHAATGADDELREQLKQAVRTKSDLARLATNPLLCGLLCALHRERRGFLPSGRRELYNAALSMLLRRRDLERRLRLPELSEEPQLQLLQRLAYWLIRNGRTELDRERAERVVREALPAVPEAERVLGDEKAVLRHFVERTGLLRAPSVDTVEFVHRTFQDFLGARAALDAGDFGVLSSHAEDDQWEDVIRMAVAQGRPRERAELIGDLLGRQSARSALLAFACLEYAAELDPELRARVQAAAAPHIPPTGIAAAEALGRVGPLVLELLPGPENASDERVAFYTVVAAGSVGSDLAIPFLARYAGDPSALVQGKLAEFWPRFDTVQYAEEVIARLGHVPGTLYVHSDAELDALGTFAPQERVNTKGAVSGAAFSHYLGRTRVTSLNIRDNKELTGLDFLEGMRSLRTISLMGCPALADLGGLAGLPVEHAQLHLDGPLDVGAVTAGWSALQGLTLSGPHAPWSLDDLSPDADLRSLVLGRSPGPLSGLARHPQLRFLALPDSWEPVDGAADWRTIAALPRLRELSVPAGALGSLPGSLRLRQLRVLKLTGDEAAAAAHDVRVRRHFPKARATTG